ncbi:MAG TPA: SWIM zinc finger family protein, partial [Actinotalea sp.]|nr:SWIM zinc finger family protein [Actinotalea sp.]
MVTVEDLARLTDAVTISRGRAYTRQGRVRLLRSAPSEVRAEVLGTQTYQVHLGEASWSCDCPVGVSGALCKHAVAVVVAAALPGEQDPGAPDPADAWLDSLDAAALRDLLRQAVVEVPGVAAVLALAHIAATDDVTALSTEVEEVLKPRRRFYEYRQANTYAAEAEPLIRLLTDRAARPSGELLDVIERALALSVRTILRSDDSSGAQGDQIHRLLDLHAQVAAGITGTLDAKARRRLARWLHGFVFAGKQDVFEVDVDRYADALGRPGVAEYRTLLEKSAAVAGPDAFAVRYARGRLAVLDRDPDAIVTVIGQGLSTQYRVLSVVQALDDAALPDLAVEHATRGLALAHSPHAGALVQRLVDDATARGDADRVLSLRRDAFTRDPSSTTLAAYAAAARTVGTWDIERDAAESTLATARPWEWISVLLN